MRRFSTFLFIVLAVVALLVLFTPLRYYNPPLEGAGGYSRTMQESKERGVFMFEYEAVDNPVPLNNGAQLRVYSAWVEKAWTYEIFSNKSRIDRDPPLYNIVITVEDNIDSINNILSLSVGRKLGIRCIHNTNILETIDNELPKLLTTIDKPTEYLEHRVVLIDTGWTRPDPRDTIGTIRLKRVE